ncbi:hypothetical protein H8E77_18490 [bacterium]|nr:hypothetical protein [bacterium]
MAYVRELEIDKNGQLVISPELVNYLSPSEEFFYCILSDGAITIVPENGYKVDEEGNIQNEPEDEASLLKKVLAELDGELEWYETNYGMSSKEFYAKWRKDEIKENFDMNVWASTYLYKQELMSGERKP